MIIPVNISLPTSLGDKDQSRQKLPPQLAKLGDANSDELVLIELQGDIEAEGSKIGQVAGALKFDAKDKPTLMIGHNLLEGKLVNLPKPLAVLHRHSEPLTATPDAMDVDSGRPSQQTQSWDMVAIVKRKIVFSKRPMPIVGLAAKRSAAQANEGTAI